MSTAGDNRARGNGFKFHVGTAELRKAGRNGGRKRHGDTIIYLEGKPISLQRVSAETGITVDILARRSKAARERGQVVTMDWLTRPVQEKAPRKSTAWSGYVVRKALR